MMRGEFAEAAEWNDRAARSPGAHVLIAMIAAAAHFLAGDEQKALKWAREVRERNPGLSRQEFFGAFPLRSDAMRTKASGALEKLGF